MSEVPSYIRCASGSSRTSSSKVQSYSYFLDSCFTQIKAQGLLGPVTRVKKKGRGLCCRLGGDPQKALRGSIPSSFLEPFPRFCGNCCQKLTNLVEIDYGNTPTKGLAWNLSVSSAAIAPPARASPIQGYLAHKKQLPPLGPP